MYKSYCVYKITNPFNNKCYIGITSRKPEIRWNNGNGYADVKDSHFYNAIQKYGWDNFKHEILFENLTKEEACEKEIELIAEYKSNNPEFGYNLSKGGESGSYGYKHTLEQNRAKSLRQLGKKHKPHSEETKQKISKSKKGKKINRTKEHNQKISASLKGRKYSKERCKHMSEANKGRKLSEETKQKISNTMKGRKLSDACIEKMLKLKRIPVYQYDSNFNFINSYISIAEASRKCNISSAGILKSCKTYSKVKNYYWRKELIDE